MTQEGEGHWPNSSKNLQSNIETFTAYTLNAFSCTLDTFNAQFINLVGNLDMTGT